VVVKLWYKGIAIRDFPERISAIDLGETRVKKQGSQWSSAHRESKLPEPRVLCMKSRLVNSREDEGR
jgi:hypothetical protein